MRMRRKRLALGALLAVVAALTLRPAYAHGFGERYDLPVPLNMFLVGAAATVGLSFVVIGFFVHRRSGSFSYPRYNLIGPRWINAALTGRISVLTVKGLGVAVLALVVATGLFGTDSAIDNLSPTFVWIIWWVGMGYVTALMGNLWALVNPWKTSFEWAERLIGSGTRGREAALFRYPERWDVWPALLLFLAFAWTENVYSGAAVPFKLALLVLLYSAITWAGMLAFGKHQWLRHGETFSVLFGFFARFSPTEVRVDDGRLCRACGMECYLAEDGCVDCYECFERASPDRREFNLRPFAVGLALPRPVSAGTAFFVILALATVTFDGLTATPLWVDIRTELLSPASAFGVDPLKVVDTLALVLFPVLFFAVYAAFSWAIRQLSGQRVPVDQVVRAFVFSLDPIALAYNTAHFLSLLAIQGQLIFPLVSDPFGFGWDLFGTSDYRIDITVVNAKFIWFMSVSAIVLGHIVSVYLAHVVSLRRMADHSMALRSQYPMLVLMVFYTATSLWIIAQPIVK